MKKFDDFVVFKIFKKIKLRSLIILIILLVFNSYAWFVYSTKVAVGLETHVLSWDVVIQAGGGATNNLPIVIDRMYPGMEKFEKTVEIRNSGELKAQLSYQIKSYDLLGNKFELSDELTSNDLESKLLNDYPFKVTLEKTVDELDSKGGYGTFKLSVEWPFESGNDELDTYWGEEAYSFNEEYPDDPSLYVDILLSVEQVNN